MHRICVVGTGYVGLPLAALLSKNYPVIGFDVDRTKIGEIASGRAPFEEPGLQELLTRQIASGRLGFTARDEELSDCDVKILTVGTPYDPAAKNIDYSQLDQATAMTARRLRRGDIVVVKSTVPPGTTQTRVRNAVESHGFRVPDEVGLAYSPERIVEGQALKDYATLPKIIGATDDRTFGVVHEVLGSLGGPVRRVSGPGAAEMVKMVDNYSRYVFLGLTNEIALIAEKVGVDVMEVIESAKYEYPRNAGILRPGPGVGGSCLNKDPFILAAVLKEHGVELAMVESAARVNRSIPSHIVDLVQRFARARRTVAVAGIAFKKDTDDFRFSPVFEIRDEMTRRGFTVRLTDPYARPTDMKVEPDLFVAAKGANVLLLLTDHTAYDHLDLERLKREMSPDSLIVDARGGIDRATATQAGFEYHRFGGQ